MIAKIAADHVLNIGKTVHEVTRKTKEKAVSAAAEAVLPR
jgi:hypothetical protein